MSFIPEGFYQEHGCVNPEPDPKKLAKLQIALEQLNDFEEHIQSKGDCFIGYPCNRAFDLKTFFDWWTQSHLSKIPLNDVGNPDDNSSYGLNARVFERELLMRFATLYKLPLEKAWGYTTTGGTLGNEQGLYLGRENLRKHGKVMLYVSEEAHYSIRSLAKVLDIEIRIIKCQANGEMNYEELRKAIDPLRPALFSVSIGTTFKGAIDDITQIHEIVKQKGVKYSYFHADAALFGGHLSFLNDPAAPKIDFQNSPFDSCAVSGHKFFGSPIPVGFFLVKREHISLLQEDYIEYINSSNVTIPCSRSALSTLILWWLLQTKSDEYPSEAKMLLDNALYLQNRLEAIGVRAHLNAYSNTVYFSCPSKSLCEKWFLATTHCSHLGALAHVVVMQHVSKELLDSFVLDMQKEMLK